MVDAIIPYKKTVSREPGFKIVKAWLEYNGFNVIIGSCKGEWNKGKAIHNGVLKSKSDIIIINDADLICNFSNYSEFSYSPLIIPFDSVIKLDKSGNGLMKRDYIRIAGGCWILRREVYDDVGGVDPRFEGWGGEDWAFCVMVETLHGGIKMIHQSAIHIWHEENLEKSIEDNQNLDIIERYKKARFNENEMRQISNEIKELLISGSMG